MGFGNPMGGNYAIHQVIFSRQPLRAGGANQPAVPKGIERDDGSGMGGLDDGPRPVLGRTAIEFRPHVHHDMVDPEAVEVIEDEVTRFQGRETHVREGRIPVSYTHLTLPTIYSV